MVIEDSGPKKSNHAADSIAHDRPNLSLASAWERAGAFTIDMFSVLLPLCILLTAPLKRSWILSIHFDEVDNQEFWLVGMILSGIFAILTYQTLLTWIFGATLGKMFFGLKVEDVWSGKKLKFNQAFFRACIWTFEIFLFFIPHLAILHNRRRRPMHDRMSDSVVVTTTPRHLGEPHITEISFGHSLMAVVWALLAVLTSFELHEIYKHFSDPTEIAGTLEEDGALCTSIGKALSQWPEQGDGPTSRLEVAMSLYAAGETSDECLDAEAQFSFKISGPNSLGYLAKSFVEANHEVLSDMYLTEVCKLEVDSTACRFSQLLKIWAGGDEDQFLIGLENLAKTSPEYIRIWTIRHLISHDQFASVDTYLNRLPPHPSMAGFLGMARARTFWGQNQPTSAAAVSRTLYENLGNEDRLELAGWLCLAELNRSCQYNNSMDCSLLSQKHGDFKEAITDIRQGLAMVKLADCKDGEFDTGLIGNLENDDLKVLAMAIRAHRRGDAQNALQSVGELLSEKTVNADIKIAALGKWLDWEKTAAARLEIYETWKAAKKSLAWFELGRRIMSEAILNKAFSQVAEIGEALGKFKNLEDSDRQQIARARLESKSEQRLPASEAK